MSNIYALKKEDYEEPRCVLCKPASSDGEPKESIPLMRVSEKLDYYCALKDFASAERHLSYWLSEAESFGDMKGLFGIRNEMMGFYRKQGNEKKATENAEKAKELISELGMEDSITAGTCYVNCGTVYDNFGYPDKALDEFKKALHIYEQRLRPDDSRLGGLYNNMALALCDLKQYEQAYELNCKALDVMSSGKGNELECAITYLNMADAAALQYGFDKSEEMIKQYLHNAGILLDNPEVARNGYYAYVCERCAPSYSCYGLFDYSEELCRRADEIYRRMGDAE